MWLWSVTWCAQWRVLSGRPSRDAARAKGSAEDWSGDNSAAALIAHVRGRVDHYLDPGIVARVRADWADPASPLRDL